MKVLLLIVLMLLLTGCIAGSVMTDTCLDGKGDDSYFPNPNKTINIESMEIVVPPQILDSRIAYIEVDDCKNSKNYFIKSNGGFQHTSAEEFFTYIKENNVSCNGCLDMYSSGCC